jgi:hypothetical protein
MRILPELSVTSMVILGLVVLVPPAEGQKTTIPSSMLVASGNSTVIAGQLRFASQLGHKCLARLEAEPAEESGPVDDSLVQCARDTYVLIRAARGGLKLQRDLDKFPDPERAVISKHVEDAWNLARTPVDSYNPAYGRDQYLPGAIRDLSKSLRLIDTVLVLMP